jgi:hypothetical protein
MAALDRALSNGERMLANMDQVCGVLCGLVPRGWKRKGGADAPSQPSPPPDTGPAPAASV